MTLKMTLPAPVNGYWDGGNRLTVSGELFICACKEGQCYHIKPDGSVHPAYDSPAGWVKRWQAFGESRRKSCERT